MALLSLLCISLPHCNIMQCKSTFFVNIAYLCFLGSQPRVNVTVQRGDCTLASSPCVHSKNELIVSCKDSLSSSSVEWFVNGVHQGSTGARLRATVTGNYTCITTNVCGDVTNTTFIKGLLI